MGKLIIASNRVSMPNAGSQPGGLAVALSDALNQYGGMWCGWSGEIDASRNIQCESAADIDYCTLHYTEEEYATFYLGHSNSHLWPFFHYRSDLSHFCPLNYAGYQAVNARYADALAGRAQPEDTIWVQDYHFIPLGEALRERGVNARIGFFLHIPFPAPEVLCASPVHQDILTALSAYDLVGFQTMQDLYAFSRNMVEYGGARILRQTSSTLTLEVNGRRFTAGCFPISIDTPQLESAAAAAGDTMHIRHLQERFQGRDLVIGVDRLDYSKGLLLRMEAYEHFLSAYSHKAEDTTYVQIAPPSRGDVAEYRVLREELETKAAHINGLHACIGHTPICYLCQSFDHDELAGLYRMARVGLVTPLRDGMNLVAKEYVACQNPDDPGVLILSEFAGAAQELDAALLINPHDPAAVGDTIHAALNMTLTERRDRHAAMLDVLRQHTIHDWAQAFLETLQNTSAENGVMLITTPKVAVSG